ncbi:unnamed protein product [Cunninghamella blakesleeana]
MSDNLKWHSCSATDYPLKRRKVAKACQGCRTKKMKCDGHQPCGRCVNDKKKCEYESSPKSQQQYNKNISSSLALSMNTTTTTTKRNDKEKQNHFHKSNHTKSATYFNWHDFNKIIFTHDVKDQTTNNNHNHNHNNNNKMTNLPPLLFDFYHLTYHPNKIWSEFQHSFQGWYQQSSSFKPIPLPIEFIKHTLFLFSTYNSLYSLFIDISELDLVLKKESYLPIFSSSPSIIHQENKTKKRKKSHRQQQEDEVEEDNNNFILLLLILLEMILSLTFLAAYQVHELNHYKTIANYFYEIAYHRYIQFTFLKSQSSFYQNNNPQQLVLLVQASILMIHYQCNCVCEQKAYMTLKLAQGWMDRLILLVSSSRNDIKETVSILKYILYAWQIWFSIYLHYHDDTLLPPPPTHFLASSSLTWELLTKYVDFFYFLLSSKFYLKPISMKTISEKSQELKLFILSKNTKSNITLSNMVLQLYHSILTIQLFGSQCLTSFDFFDSDIKKLLIQKKEEKKKKSQNDDDDDDDDSDDSLFYITKASREIIQLADTISNNINNDDMNLNLLFKFIKYRAIGFAMPILILQLHNSIIKTDHSSFQESSICINLIASLKQLKNILNKESSTYILAKKYSTFIYKQLPTSFMSNIINNKHSHHYQQQQQQHYMYDYHPTSTSSPLSTITPTTTTSPLSSRQYRAKQNERPDIDQEQLNKLLFENDPLFSFPEKRKYYSKDELPQPFNPFIRKNQYNIDNQPFHFHPTTTTTATSMIDHPVMIPTALPLSTIIASSSSSSTSITTTPLLNDLFTIPNHLTSSITHHLNQNKKTLHSTLHHTANNTTPIPSSYEITKQNYPFNESILETLHPTRQSSALFNNNNNNNHYSHHNSRYSSISSASSASSSLQYHSQLLSTSLFSFIPPSPPNNPSSHSTNYDPVNLFSNNHHHQQHHPHHSHPHQPQHNELTKSIEDEWAFYDVLN